MSKFCIILVLGTFYYLMLCTDFKKRPWFPPYKSSTEYSIALYKYLYLPLFSFPNNDFIFFNHFYIPSFSYVQNILNYFHLYGDHIRNVFGFHGQQQLFSCFLARNYSIFYRDTSLIPCSHISHCGLYLGVDSGQEECILQISRHLGQLCVHVIMSPLFIYLFVSFGFALPNTTNQQIMNTENSEYNKMLFHYIKWLTNT